jgi:hypothetical protein
VISSKLRLECSKTRNYRNSAGERLNFICFLLYLCTVVTGGNVYVLDLAAKIDQCAEYLCKAQWGDIEFPPPFGRDALPEVRMISARFQVT